MITLCFGVGAFAAALVYVGDSMQWPHLNRRSGYIGTAFIIDILYAINDPYAIHIVAILWFLHAFLAAGILVLTYQLLMIKRERSDLGSH